MEGKGKALEGKITKYGGAGGTLAPPEFGSSVNPIPTRGGTLCPSHYG